MHFENRKCVKMFLWLGQTPLGSLQRSPDPLLDLEKRSGEGYGGERLGKGGEGNRRKTGNKRWRGGEGKKREG